VLRSVPFMSTSIATVAPLGSMVGYKRDIGGSGRNKSKFSGDIELQVDLVAFLGKRGHPFHDLNFKVSRWRF